MRQERMFAGSGAQMMTFGSLFAGIGGFDLGLERAGMECAWQVEIDEFCLKVLSKHWPHVPKYRDIREVGDNLETVDLICGGFPCQPYSVAGKRRGEEDTRDLWPEMFRVIKTLRPAWVVGENVPGLLSIDNGRRFSRIIHELESEGYEARTFVLPAANYGAPFEGKRVFIIATAEGSGHRGRASEKCRVFERELVTQEPQWCETWGEAERCLVRTIRTQAAIPEHLRSDYGLPDWVDRIRSLGNAVVPQVAEAIGRAVIRTEQMAECESFLDEREGA